MKKLLPMGEELRNLNGKKRVIRNIRPSRVKISPLGIEDFKKGDESTTYRRKNKVWYKADSKAEPELLSFNGLAIWNYNEFLTDINFQGKSYRIFYNPISKKLLANEIISHNYKDEVLLRNPVDRKLSERLEKVFLKAHLPKNKRLDTIAHFKRKIEKFYKQEEINLQSKKQLVGNQPSATLLDATLWCINSHPKHYEFKRPTLLRAYKKFGAKTHTEESFIKMVRQKWTNLIKKYNRQPEEIKKEKSLKLYAKSELKIPRNTSKQKVKENKKTFN